MEGARAGSLATLDEYKKNPQFVEQTEEDKPLPQYLTLVSGLSLSGLQVGHDHRPERLRGLQRLRRRPARRRTISRWSAKIEVARGRHMHWIRVDRYFKGNWDNPELYFQPVPCMQCENAPCELVCPVAATVHSGDGLNQMVYNRCVGTRYCSNNCPYKVRRFNFLLYSDWDTAEPLPPCAIPTSPCAAAASWKSAPIASSASTPRKSNPEKENRRIADGEIIPACAQACPTQAIAFGDINDPKSRVAQLKAQARNYSLLEELNTRPRTTYLGRLRNPNPEIEKG